MFGTDDSETVATDASAETTAEDAGSITAEEPPDRTPDEVVRPVEAEETRPADEDATRPTDETEPSDSMPASATAREEAALRRVRGLSTLLDDAIPIPGTDRRIGIDPIVGILPVGGDLATAVLALYPILEAYRFGASRGTLAWMLGRVVVDAVVGSIPVLGGVFDAVFKANEWNTRTFERHIEQRG